MKTAAYSFCEAATAGPLAAWHIRPLTAVGPKFGGGVDTASLCGHVRPALGGWDVRVAVDGYPLDKSFEGRRLVCATCVAAYRHGTGR